MARIQTATPPETTFEGQLQRMRDRNRAAVAGEPEDEPVDDVATIDDEENDDMVLDDLPDRPPAPVRRALVARSPRPGHRQAPPRPTSATGEPSWWVTSGRDGFTSAGEKATEQSRHRKEAAGIGLGSLARD